MPHHTRRRYFSDGPLGALLTDALSGLWELEPRSSLVADEGLVLRRWMEGAAVPDIAIEAQVEPQELTRFIEDFYSYKMPWGVSSYLRVAAFELDDLNPSVLASNIAGIIKYGVPTVEAAWAMTAGIASRRAAIDVSAHFITEVEVATASAFRRWLGRLDPDSLGEELGLHGSDLEVTARAVLRSRANDYLRALDESGEILPLETTVRLRRLAFDVGVAQQLDRGTEIELIRDLDSQLNRNAIYVSFESENVGYLPADAAQALAPELDIGRQMTGTILEVADGDARLVIQRE